MTNTTKTRRPPRATRQPRTLFPGCRRFQLRLAGILEAKRLRALAVVTTLLLGACRAAVPSPVVETVGNLTASDTHVIQAPVHATTDLGVAYQAVSGDEDADDVTTSAPAETVEAPDVAPKAGLVMGRAR